MADPSSDYGASQAATATSTGTNALNSYDPSSTANSLMGSNNALASSQLGTAPSNAGDYMTQYANTIANNPTATQLYSTANNMFNVPGLAQNATNLNNAVLQAPQQSLDAARGFNYDANQVANQTNLTLGRLSPLASAATNQSQTAQNLAGQYVTQGMAQNNMNLLPIQAEGQTLNQVLAQQATGWNTSAQGELNGLLAKMQSGVTLSSAELDRANTLAQMETSYNNTLNTNATDLQIQNLKNQFQNVDAGSTLVNTVNGGIVNPGTLAQQTGLANYG